MNRLVLLVVACGTVVLLSGCVGFRTNSYGFPSAPPALITDLKVGQFIQDRALERPYTVVGPVSSKATSTCYLYIVSTGDASYQYLKKDALSGKQADDLIDVEIDCHHKSILGIINEVTTSLNATAIKYDK